MPTQRIKTCIDRILPRELQRRQLTVRRDGRLRAISPIGKTWVNGSNLQVRFMGGTAAQQELVKTEASWWSDVANLTFDFNDASDAEIRIAFDENDGAWSWIGTESRSIALNEPTMNLGFLDPGTVAHEFGHAIGLAHEHANPEGGIQWNEAVVFAEAAKPPNFWDEETARHNILFKYTADQINGTKFDPESIMLYFFPPEWTLNGIGTEENQELSSLDKQFIAGAKMYPREAQTVNDATGLQVNAKRRTAAAIGKAGEQDIFVFDVAKGGRHIIDTSGPTDVVMKLYGPNSPTLLLEEDDDSGVKANARIIADLIEGRYYVQVNHVKKTSGKGKYSIRVRRA